MSHISKIELQVTDLDALKAAVKRLHPSLQFKTDQKSFHWYGRFVGDSPVPEGMTVENYGKCLHAIGFPTDQEVELPHPHQAGKTYKIRGGQAYELGVVTLPGTKGYTLVYDNFAGGLGLEAVIGKNAGLLKQAYAREVAVRQMRRQGYKITEKTDEHGTLQLVCTKPGRG